MQVPFPRGPGDIQTAVVNLVGRLAPYLPVADQPAFAHEIAETIASRPNIMRDNMRLRQGILRRATATDAHVVEALAAWAVLLFDLGNLQHNRARALDIRTSIPDDDVDRLARALDRSRNGCILAIPHIGSVELFVTHLKDRGFNTGFVFTIGADPTPTERWILAGRRATRGTPIAFGRRNTGAEIADLLAANGVLFMVVDVYPSDRFTGIDVAMFGGTFNVPPGPARYAAKGTLVLPGFASRGDDRGLSMRIFDPIEPRDTAAEFARAIKTELKRREK